MIKITGNKGYQMTFENGYTVSVQIGHHHNCDNKRLGRGDSEEPMPPCKNAETALIDENGEFIYYEGNDPVQSDMTPAMVLELMNYAQNLPSHDSLNRCHKIALAMNAMMDMNARHKAEVAAGTKQPLEEYREFRESRSAGPSHNGRS